MTPDYRDFYRGRKVMVTGGLGFIDSNLARRLVELDANVLLVDSLIDDGEVFNVGDDQPISHRELASLLVEVAGSGRIEFVDWPADKKEVDIGNFYADSTKFKQAVGWKQTVSLRDGLRQTVAFCREHYSRYVNGPSTGTKEPV